MNNHILTASEFQFSSSFFDNELEKVLRECVGIYTEIINKKTTFPNDEEKIRNGFLVYLKDDNYKNTHSPLNNYHFDKEEDDSQGRVDIRILPVNPYQGDKAFYSIECKRLNNIILFFNIVYLKIVLKERFTQLGGILKMKSFVKIISAFVFSVILD